MLYNCQRSNKSRVPHHKGLLKAINRFSTLYKQMSPKFRLKFSRRMGVSNWFIIAALAFAIIFICHAKPPAPEDIGTNFFLKASKSVPRIGRRTMEYENYFLKASKSIPRIGRRTLSSSGESDGEWLPKDSQEPVKRTFFEKYFKENEQPVWSDLEKLYQDYPGIFQGEEVYPKAGTNPKPDPYWPRTKKEEELLEQPQNQNE